MAKIRIEGKEYDTENLPQEAVNYANSIAFVDSELQRLDNQVKVYSASRRYYVQELKNIVEKTEEKESAE
ncbi:MAG TPA: hypothetical protein DHM44_07435 [Flexistipes sinusarabici]|uniref:Uncharacterized protein n=1 Tax=Flexistipes sinusarabici TaxID=2352 RepID=A0A3D5QDZ3_FLESI|nr:hypothetical protein [Flexistipes sinusarabici]